MRIPPSAARLLFGLGLGVLTLLAAFQLWILPRLEEELVHRLQAWTGRMSIALRYDTIRPSWFGVRLAGIHLNGHDIEASGSAEVELNFFPNRRFLSPRRIILEDWHIRWERTSGPKASAQDGTPSSRPDSKQAPPSLSRLEQLVFTLMRRDLSFEMRRSSLVLLDAQHQELLALPRMDLTFSSQDQALQVHVKSLRYRQKEFIRDIDGQLLLQSEGQRYPFLMTAHDTGDLPWQLQGSLSRDFDSIELRHKRQGLPLAWQARLHFLGPRDSLQLLIKLNVQGLSQRERLNFDAQVASNNLELQHELLGEAPWGPFPFSLRAKGDLALESGALRISQGLAHLVAHQKHAPIRSFFKGEKSDLLAPLDQEPLRLSFEVPETPCQVFMDALPSQAFPLLEGFSLQGNLSAAFHLQLAKPTEALLQFAAQNFACQLQSIPQAFTRLSLLKPREHRSGESLDPQRQSPGFQALSDGDFTPLREIPEAFLQGVIAAEDGGFWKHDGFRWGSLQAAMQANLKAGRVVYGGSTLTMQLVKNLYLKQERVLSRKVQELFLAWSIEQVLSKEEILELYTNVVEFGPAMRGIAKASQGYFGKAPRDLSVAESIYLASILPSPHRFFADHYCSGQLDDSIVKRMQKTAEGVMALASASYWQREFQASLRQLHFPNNNMRHYCRKNLDIGLGPQSREKAVY